jgi:hypothetical protein
MIQPDTLPKLVGILVDVSCHFCWLTRLIFSEASLLDFVFSKHKLLKQAYFA